MPELKTSASSKDETKESLRKALKHDFGAHMQDVGQRAELLKAFLDVTMTRQSLVKTYEGLRSLDVVQIALDVLIDDGFLGSNEGDFFSIIYSEKKRMPSGNRKKLGMNGENPSDDSDFEITDDSKEESLHEDKDDDDSNGEDDDETESDEETEEEAEKGQSKTEKKINREIRRFIVDLNLIAFVKDILEDLLLTGDYAYRIKSVDGSGVTEIVDDVDQEMVIPIYDASELDFFLEKQGKRFKKREPGEMQHFCLSGKKIRIKMVQKRSRLIGENEPELLPEYVRVGRSVLYPALKKLKRLTVTEMAAVAKGLKKVMMPSLVSLGVPTGQPVSDVKEAITQYEQALNSYTRTIKDPAQFTFAEMYEMIGRIKILPHPPPP